MSKKEILIDFMAKVWNNQREDLVEKFVSEKYEIHLDAGELNHSFNSFPDINFEITSAIEDNNHVAITWILTGTNLGAIGNIPPTNKKVKAKGMTFYFFEGDLISGHSQVFDRATISKQLGFV